MRLATGISSLFLALLAGIQTYFVFITAVLNNANGRDIGYTLVIIMLLLIFGGALSFNQPKKAERLFLILWIMALIATIVFSWIMLVWTILGFVLYRMSIEKAATIELGQ